MGPERTIPKGRPRSPLFLRDLDRFTVGLCYGALVAVLLSLSTLRWYSDHWLPQSLLAIAFVANSANQTHVHARAWMIARVTGSKLCAEIYGAEWLGALTALAAINLPLG